MRRCNRKAHYMAPNGYRVCTDHRDNTSDFVAIPPNWRCDCPIETPAQFWAWAKANRRKKLGNRIRRGLTFHTRNP